MSKRILSSVTVLATLAFGVVVAAPTTVVAAGTASLTALGVAYTQDFDTLASTGTANTTVPTGWDFSESGTNANTTYRAGTGSDNTGDTYSFGASGSAERAFGGLRSGSLVPLVGASFTNDTGAVVTALAVTYTGEQWRLGQNTAGRAADRLDFQLSTTATSLTTGTWTDYDGLDFASLVVAGTVGALNGNASPNRTVLSFTITGLTIATGASFWIRWADSDLIPGADDGLAIDDFSITPFVPDPAPAVVATTPANGAVDVVLTSNLSVTFSEPVNVSTASFDLSCPSGGARSFGLSGGPITFVLDPAVDFANSETCTLRVLAALVSDQDTSDPFDTMAADSVTTFTTIGPDSAPAVASTIPADGSTNVPLNQNVIINFTEPVNVTEPWFTLTCATSGGHPAVVTGGPTSFTLDPSTDFVYGEACTLVIDASAVTDLDSNDPPDDMLIDFIAGFTTEPDPCTVAYTPAYSIQGSGLSAAITGNVTTQGVVVGDFEGTAAAGGFYLQDLIGDANPATSDGIFVFTGSSNLVSVGQVVRVTGFARERFNQTTINGSNSNTAAVPAGNIRICGTGSVAATDVVMPFANADAPERYEGMLVRFPQTLVISEYFNYDRFGEIVLALPLDGESRPFTGTAIDEPGSAANARTLANSLRRITLDDAQSAQNPATLRHPNGDPFSLTNRFRGGDTVTDTIGVLGYDFSLYRVIPTGGARSAAVNPRPAAPDPVGGTVRVAAMNTLNYFITLDYPSSNPLDNTCGPARNVECRGADADQPEEFGRQRAKLLAALSGLGADIIGLNELENTTGVEPLADIVAGLPGYAYVATGTIGTDAIKVGLVYKPAVVTPVGSFELLTSADDPRFIDTKSRPSLAQTFEVNATGARFTVVVNHLKSKGSACDDVGDPDLGDGQGNCSQTRRAAADALVDWLATDPTGSGDPDFLIVGDLNSYAQEDTIDEIKAGSDDTADTGDDYTNLIARYQGTYAYSYTFDGQAGYLDHALANASLAAQITGATEWHINSDEPDVLDYDTSFKPPTQDALYEPNQYRASDHDPVIVGLTPNAPPTVDAGGPYSVGEGGTVTLTASGSDPNGDALTYAWDLDGDGTFETAGQSVTFSAAALDGPTSAVVAVRATDPLGLTADDAATVDVTNVAPTVTASFADSVLACGPDNATLVVSFTDPAAADTHSVTVSWGDGSTDTVVPSATSPTSLSHTYALAGVYTATATVTDDDGGTGSATASTTVNFQTTGVLPPINADGTSVFKYKSTIPVKVVFTDCDGSVPADLAPTISVQLISGATPSLPINEPVSTSAADTAGRMRFSDGQYVYNLATRPLPDSSGTYRITIKVPRTGQVVTATFGLRP